MLQQSAACILKEVKHMLETFLSSVVGVGYLALFMAGAELAEKTDFGLLKCARVQFNQVGLILPIHGKHEIKFSQV